MDADQILLILEKLFSSSLPDAGLWLAFIAIFVLKPMGKRLNAVSLYIKRFLAIQQRRAKAAEALDATLSKLVTHLDRE